jgi:hypothetical protein
MTYPYLLFSVVQEQPRIASIEPEQLAIYLIHGAGLFPAQGRRRSARKT